MSPFEKKIVCQKNGVRNNQESNISDQIHGFCCQQLLAYACTYIPLIAWAFVAAVGADWVFFLG